ncbi:hypothetical protein GJ496_006568 [Pomphorhynchus laevis]|nr:hypothetical protein GJ496_006568 [Pomphorhynchus laevis]
MLADVKFLKRCKHNGLIPTFAKLRFTGCTAGSKVTARLLRQCSFRLITHEIRSKYSLRQTLMISCSADRIKLLASISQEDWDSCVAFLVQHADYILQTKRSTLYGKWNNLKYCSSCVTINFSYSPAKAVRSAGQCGPINNDIRQAYDNNISTVSDKNVVNLSGRMLTCEEVSVLSLGLNYGIRRTKFDSVAETYIGVRLEMFASKVKTFFPYIAPIQSLLSSLTGLRLHLKSL